MIHTEHKLDRAFAENYLRYPLAMLCFAVAVLTYAQDDQPLSIDNIEIPEVGLPLCFGFSDIGDLRALAICDALNLDQNVKARTPELLQFLKQLKKNNNREWFQKNQLPDN